MDKKIYILIGPQGSGKTQWSINMDNGSLFPNSGIDQVIRVSQDEQGRDGHWRLFIECIEKGMSIVVDRMNFNYDQRDRYTIPARKHGYTIIFVLFDISKATCLLRLANRGNHPTIKQTDNHNTILDTFFSNFERPTFDEYDELLTIREKPYCNILDLSSRGYDEKIIIVGDIHGCFDDFINLLNKCKYDHSKDIVISTGDLVDRGPKIKETLKWFYITPNAYSVVGNHDNKAMRYWAGNNVKINNGLSKTIEQIGNDQSVKAKKLSQWINSWPHIIRVKNIKTMTRTNMPLYIVHAGIDGRKSIYEQTIETCLYARYLDGENFSDKQNGIQWWKTLSEQYRIASGHIMTNNARPCCSAYCLDGGAYRSETMRALVIENSEKSIFEINAKGE